MISEMDKNFLFILSKLKNFWNFKISRKTKKYLSWYVLSNPKRCWKSCKRDGPQLQILKMFKRFIWIFRGTSQKAALAESTDIFDELFQYSILLEK